MHRAHSDVVVTQGNHDALGPPLPLIREWLPFEILHFPLRSSAQTARKFRVARTGGLASPGTSVPQHTEAAVRAMDVEGDRAFYARLVVDDEAVEEGLAGGALIVGHAAPRRAADAHVGGCAPRGATPTLAEDAAFAVEAQAMLAHDGWVRLTERAERLQRRIERLERSRLVPARPR